jgi:copper homeostasis protein
MTIEIVVYNFESAVKAHAGGANRIELCDNPGEGGTTPSMGMIETVRNKLNLDLFVMIRPRGGDFYYSADEYEIMKRDIMMAKRLGADGVVFGILTASGRIDIPRCTELIQLAKPMSVTCHRAFDMTRDLSLSLEECITCGFDRVLTSGGKLKAIDGVENIAALKVQAGGRISLMPGSGVNESNVVEIVTNTKADQIHFSASMLRPSEMEFRNPYIQGMGSDSGSEFVVRTVDPTIIKKIATLISALK